MEIIFKLQTIIDFYRRAQNVNFKYYIMIQDLSKAYDPSFWTQVPVADKKF